MLIDRAAAGEKRAGKAYDSARARNRCGNRRDKDKKSCRTKGKVKTPKQAGNEANWGRRSEVKKRSSRGGQRGWHKNWACGRKFEITTSASLNEDTFVFALLLLPQGPNVCGRKLCCKALQAPFLQPFSCARWALGGRHAARCERQPWRIKHAW